MQLTLQQGCKGKNKQRLDTDPLAKPTEIPNAVLALYPMKSATPLQKGASFVTETLVRSTQADSQIYQGW